MKGENFNISGHKTRVLVAPLEWGLGHATRCIPVINELIRLNCEVFIGAEDASQALLQKEFPQLTFLQLRGYRMQYSRKKYWLPLKIVFQFPKMIWSIYNEHQWLKKIIKERAIEAVISDNRFGLYHSSVPCIYITHQLTIKTGNRFTEWLAQKIHYHFINKYSACWVPDAPGEINLAGTLSHPNRFPKTPVQYIGPLSRFEKNGAEKKYDIVVIISGPEPQRTIFENVLFKAVENYDGKCLFIRGLPEDVQMHPDSYRDANMQIEVHNHLSAVELNNAIEQSALVISRSGYTTVMDLVKLQHKAILIPTPGQTEQEYLAKNLMSKKIIYCVEQNNFSLQEELKKQTGFAFSFPSVNQDEYKVVIEKFINGLKAG